MKKILKWIATCFLSLLCFALTACGVATTDARGGVGISLGGSTDPVVANSLNRKIVYPVNLSLNAAKFNSVTTALNAKSAELGGYIERTDEDYDGGTCIYALVTYRIPTEKLDEFVSCVEGNGGVTGKTVYTADITNSYVDATARKEALLGERLMLQTLLNDTTLTAGDKVSIISKIGEVELELQIIEQTIGQYDAMVNYSTVCVEIMQPVGFWEIFLPISLSVVGAAGIFSAIFFPIRAAKKRKRKAVTEN